ncbi:CLUMA_CG000578, isoform A [Clunio marinus]|uniref:CLUMA_CG000578, isoform A n=1 Tax=Clunio marinus TaxID=568069 RepID=A0A1J1HKH6_9DIPT|nr:CLUMA_CG000578, isoform A [Clunio marinus]
MKFFIILAFVGFASAVSLRQGPTAECTSTNCFIFNANMDDKKLNEMIPDSDDKILAVKFTSCSLHSIPKTIFSKFPSLLCIMATNPGVREFANNTFREASSLQFLYLPGNKIRILPKYSFEGATNLNEINLAENRIEVISPHAFKNLEHLENLNLSKNLINLFEPNTFNPLVSLMNLDISGNMLEFLDASMFMENDKLNGINIANNRISAISFGFLYTLPQIRVFNVMNNPCTRKTILENMPLIKIVDGKNQNTDYDYALKRCYYNSIDKSDAEKTDFLILLESVELAREDYEDEVVADLNNEIVEKQRVIDEMISYEYDLKIFGISLIAFVLFVALCKWIFSLIISPDEESKEYMEDFKEKEAEELTLLRREPIIYTIVSEKSERF